MERLNTLSKIGLVVGAVLGVTHEVLTSPVEAAGPCKSLATRTVREFEDIGGVKDQYDQVIDKALGVIPGARVRYLVDGQIFEVTTDNRGYSERMIETACNDGNRIVATSEVTTADGRRVEDTIVLQNGRRENFRSWVVRRGSTAPVVPALTAVPAVTPGVPESPRTLVSSYRNNDQWWLLPLAVLTGIGAGLTTWYLLARRGRVPNQPLAVHGNIPVNARINTTPVDLDVDLNVNPTLRQT